MSRNVFKSTLVIGLLTLVSRISGLIRDNVFAQVLGSQAVADVFFVAFRVPNFFRRLFGEGAFSAAFIPVYSDFNENRTPQAAQKFINLITGRLGLILLAVTAVGIVFAPEVVAVIAPGFKEDPAKFALTVTVTRIMFPYLFFICLVALAAGILNTKGKFAIPAFTPIILNACLIIGAWFFARQMQQATLALAYAVLIAGFLQLAFQLPFLWRVGALPKPILVDRSKDLAAAEGASQVYKLTLPALFGVSIAQINMLINTLLASFLVTGSISWLYYSDRLMEFPVGVFGIALATAILPKLSKDYASDQSHAFNDTLDWACRWVVFIAVPSTVALMVLGEPIVITLYHYGAFSEHDALMVYQSLFAFAVGLVAIMLVKVLAPGFYARKNTRTPVRIGALAVAVNIVVSLCLFKPLGHVGLALATSVAAITNASLLYLALKRQGLLQLKPGWFVFWLRVGLASAAMAALLLIFKGDFEQWLLYGAWQRFFTVMFLVVGGFACYLLSHFILGLRPKHLMQTEG